jgi:phytoene dehydrogenase-like protein
MAPALESTFDGVRRRHPEAWAACTLYLGVKDVFDDDLAPYHQLVLDAPLPVSKGHSLFVTLSKRGDTKAAPEGFRAVTVSCHAPASAWDGLSDSEHQARKGRVAEEMLAALTGTFPALAHAEKPVVMPGTPRTWEAFTGRWGGRVGGLPFSFSSLARGYPTGRTRIPGLVRVGDTVFPGQSVPACAWGARRVVSELLAR